ncbi:MAG: hypothetical protein ACREUH_06930 [Burkholderiales bacterium]
MLECVPLETLERADGYTWRFPIEALACVERFAASEREARPGIDYEIRLNAAEGSLWLTVIEPASASALP